jgi:glycosyltransferase involved in cell wall biosynthesis
LQSGKQKVVLEYDDDYWTGSRDLNYEYRDLLIELMTLVDGVTVTTPHLRDLVHRYASGVPVYVLQNCVMWSEWQGHARWDMWPEDYVVLALTGSATHYEDWKIVDKPLRRLLKEQGNTALIFGAYCPDYMESLLTQYPDRVHFQAAEPYERYPAVIRQADIVLAPVVPDDEFNLSKSAIKAVEGMSACRTLPGGVKAGAVPVTSDTDYYRKSTGSGKRGLTVDHTEDAWHEALTALVSDNQLRMRLGRNGRKWSFQNRAIENQWPLWWNAYSQIFRRKK